MSEWETLVFDDMISGGKANPLWVNRGFNCDSNDQEKFDEIARFLEQIELICKKGNYHFDLRKDISEAPCMIDMPQRLVVYEQKLVDWSRVSEVLEAYPDFVNKLHVNVSTAEEFADLRSLYGKVEGFEFSSANAKTLICPTLSAKSLKIEALEMINFSLGDFSFSDKCALFWTSNSEYKVDNHLLQEIVEYTDKAKFTLHPGCFTDMILVMSLKCSSTHFYVKGPESEAIMQAHAIDFVKSLNDSKLKYLCRRAQIHTIDDRFLEDLDKREVLKPSDAIFIYMGQKYRDALEQAFTYKADILDELCAAKMGESGYDEAKYHFIRSFRGWFQVLSSIHKGE